MLFEWTEEKLAWYVRASRVTGFHARLADMIRPRLRAQDTVCDFGCGPGLIDLALAGTVREITAIDVASIPIEFLRREASSAGAGNIRPLVADAERMVAEGSPFPPFDVALFCYFSGPGELMKQVLRREGRLTVCVMHGMDVSKKPSKIGGSRHRAYAEEMEAFLEGEGLAYEKQELSLDFSQPLRSKEEARAFFETYAKGDDERIEAQLARVVETGGVAAGKAGGAEFPYTFPCEKDVAVFFI
ncbi:MAG: class I SAM-dependent methyltransferase [Clostridiales Family XIII bacterium]|jgi:SAM-dependent methyltransferase|nr:class I SAM-dependent methyltransferase [Clostridiales Family XIII bacterium]